jgi:predicted RNA-binding Zn-ribbon protein involved in translation (DUF1610 family)
MDLQLTSGTLAGTGTFRCTGCDYKVSLEAADQLPACPSCGGSEFARASLFTANRASQETTSMAGTELDTFSDIRAGLDDPGQYLAYDDGAETRVVAGSREWTRVGRSLAADVRFDDPTVSRRHALIVRQPDGVRVLDDRSLNGVFVNGDRVEWSRLADGDQVVVGRHLLQFIDIPVISGMRDEAALADLA